MSEEKKKEIRKKMQNLIKNKHLKKDEDAVLTLEDGSEFKVGYAEDV